MSGRSRLLKKAKQHFFMDAAMHECTEPVTDADVICGAGTKVVVTLGPACQSVEILCEMLEAGVNCARIDLTWGSIEFHRTSLRNLAAAMRTTKRLCAVWVDTIGREIIVRMPAVGDCNGWLTLEKTPLRFEMGQTVVITADPGVTAATSSLLPVSNPAFPSLVQPGQVLHVGRFLATGAEAGSLFLRVVSATPTEVTCSAENPADLVGVLIVSVSHRQMALRTHDHDLNSDLALMSDHDISCLKTFAAEFEIDFVTLSYCNSAEDVWNARTTLDQMGMTQTKIMAKIERKAAIHNFDDIVDAADGIILSRGNLGLDFEPEEMVLLQKSCVLRCNNVGKPVVVTRFVDTMVDTPRPTRAEATDVANAVLDGVDGILLGAETLRGLYPVETVKTVVRLCRSAENYFDYRTHHEDMMGEAYEEEVSLNRVYPSLFDFRLLRGEGGSGSGGSGGRALGGFGAKQSRLGAVNNGPSGATLIATANANATAHAKANAAAAAAAGGGGGHHEGQGGEYPPLLRPVTTAGPDGDGAGMLGSPGGDFGSDSGLEVGGRRVSSFGVLPTTRPGSEEHLARIAEGGTGLASSLKVESIASSAVRTAEKINAGLLVVLAQTGRTVSLVAKYRPPMPVLAVVVPTLKSSKLGWELEGKFLARQSLVLRGVHPMLAAPMAEGGEGMLGEAIACAHARGLVQPGAYVVCIMSQQGTLVVKVVQANDTGTGVMKQKLPPSLGALGVSVVGGQGVGGPGMALAADAAVALVGTPPSPTMTQKMTSMSIAGAGAAPLGVDRSGLTGGELQ